MSGSGLWQFLIVIVELLIVGGLIFLGIDFVVEAEEQFKRIAKYAVGAALLLYFLFAVGAALGLGGGVHAMAVSPIAILQLGIAIIVLFVVVKIVNIVVDRFAPEGVRAVIKLVVAAVAIVVMMIVAGNALSGGELAQNFRLR